jgi:hypothetical protein
MPLHTRQVFDEGNGLLSRVKEVRKEEQQQREESPGTTAYNGQVEAKYSQTQQTEPSVGN